MNDSIYRVYKEDFDLSVDAEKCAMEIIDYLLQNELWADVTVYANGKAWSCVSRTGKYHYENSWKTSVFCQEGINRNRSSITTVIFCRCRSREI